MCNLEPATHMFEARPVIDVLVSGQVSVDLTFLGLREVPRIGEEYHATGFAMSPGACFITVAALRKLELRTGFVTDLGSDLFSRYILEQLRAAGIEETFIRVQQRDLFELSVGIAFPQDRTFITWNSMREGAIRTASLEDLRSYRVRCLFTHLPLEPDVHAEARRQGIPLCVDAFWDPAYLASDLVWKVIQQADVFMPNLMEAYALTGTTSPEDALAALAQHVPSIVITLGPEGAIGFSSGSTYRVPALPVQAVDPTGAGDNFDAGFIYGLLRGMPFEQCIRCAIVAGSLSATKPGGVAGSPGVAELTDGLAQLEELINAHA